MRDYRDAKAMAQTLREALKAKSITISHTETLELVAQSLGFRNWHVLSAAIEAEAPSPTKTEDPKEAGAPTCLHCSFCGKSQYVVAKLIAGPAVFICDECVELCDDIILAEEPGVGENARDALASKTIDELIRLKAKAHKSLAQGHAILDLIGAAARLGSDPAPPSERSRPGPQWGFILRKTPDERLAYARDIEHRMGLMEGVIGAATSALAEQGVRASGPSA